MNKKTFITKNNGDTLEAREWNELTSYTNDIVDAVNQSNGGSGEGIPNVYVNEKGNLCIETSAELGNTKKGKINIESMDDIQIKPGDDITFYSHHREGNEDEVAIKIMNGAETDVPSDYPVKLQLNCSEINLTTKDKNLHPKDGDKAEVLDVTVNSAKSKRGYLKVRARAIDLRCEDHGGVAIQPKGNDGQGHMNKIKFEHGGGDGLEFGTFNAEKTSVFTNEYRFRRNGVIKLATRITEDSDKADVADSTTLKKYVKQEDDFYDVIDSSEATCTWADIVRYIHWAKTNNQGFFENNRGKVEADVTHRS